MKRVCLAVALAMGSLAGYGQTDNKGYEEGSRKQQSATGLPVVKTRLLVMPTSTDH